MTRSFSVNVLKGYNGIESIDDIKTNRGGHTKYLKSMILKQIGGNFENFETLFIIKQEEIWLLRSLRLMKHLSKIPILGDILF